MTSDPPAPPDVGPSSLDVFFASSQVMIRLTVRALASVDETLSFPQLRTMIGISHIEKTDNVSVSALARELGVSPSTAMRMCDRLKERGMTNRVPNPTNKQETCCVLTPKGRSLLSEILENRARLILDIVERLPDDKQTQVVEAFNLFVEASRLPSD